MRIPFPFSRGRKPAPPAPRRFHDSRGKSPPRPHPFPPGDRGRGLQEGGRGIHARHACPRGTLLRRRRPGLSRHHGRRGPGNAARRTRGQGLGRGNGNLPGAGRTRRLGGLPFPVSRGMPPPPPCAPGPHRSSPRRTRARRRPGGKPLVPRPAAGQGDPGPPQGKSGPRGAAPQPVPRPGERGKPGPCPQGSGGRGRGNHRERLGNRPFAGRQKKDHGRPSEPAMEGSPADTGPGGAFEAKRRLRRGIPAFCKGNGL